VGTRVGYAGGREQWWTMLQIARCLLMLSRPLIHKRYSVIEQAARLAG